jgi:hypothetical protein
MRLHQQGLDLFASHDLHARDELLRLHEQVRAVHEAYMQAHEEYMRVHAELAQQQ